MNDPTDHGGDTLYGISKKAHPDVDLDRLTRAGAIDIYHLEYWTPIRGDELPPALALATFDWAVNSGARAAVRGLQRACQPSYQGPVDGLIGSGTLAGVRLSDPYGVVERMCEDRIHARFRQVENDPTQAGKLRGWCNRVMKVALAAGVQLP